CASCPHGGKWQPGPWRGAPEHSMTPQGLRVIRGPVRVRSATRPTSGTGRPTSVRPQSGLPRGGHPEHTYRAPGRRGTPTTMAGQKIRIRLKAYDHEAIDASARK